MFTSHFIISYNTFSYLALNNQSQIVCSNPSLATYNFKSRINIKSIQFSSPGGYIAATYFVPPVAYSSAIDLSLFGNTALFPNSSGDAIFFLNNNLSRIDIPGGVIIDGLTFNRLTLISDKNIDGVVQSFITAAGYWTVGWDPV